MRGTTRWCFTLHNYTDDDIAAVTSWKDDLEYLIYGKEKGKKTGISHLQGFLVSKENLGFWDCKKLHPRVHWKMAYGTSQQASDYCKKQNDYTEFGSFLFMDAIANIKLSEEQEKVIKTCPRSIEEGSRDDEAQGQLIRITAAAGSGKTTTLLELALRATELGHKSLTYLTFTRAAARDGEERIRKVLQQQQSRLQIDFQARTLHSCAFSLIQEPMTGQMETEGENSPRMEDEDTKQWISKTCHDAIEKFLESCYQEISRRETNPTKATAQKKSAREKVEFYIFKSLVHFCQSSWSLEDYNLGTVSGRDYYKATVFHSSGGEGTRYGFMYHIYYPKIFFYAGQVVFLWERAIAENIGSFDIVMKRVQLSKLRVPGSILLVDESQDMDACQVDFVRQQVEFGTNVYIVGDAVQSIYGFRGARPQYLLELKQQVEKLVDCSLTESWRFGEAIAKFANFILFAKEHSPQTINCKKNNWIPYRIKVGNPNVESKVTTEPLLPHWKRKKVALIGRTNASLMKEALVVLGFNLTEDGNESGEPVNKRDDGTRSDDVRSSGLEKRSIGSPSSSTGSDEEAEEIEEECDDATDDLPEETGRVAKQARGLDEAVHKIDSSWVDAEDRLHGDLPKIHIHGRGESSGLNLWQRCLRLIEDAYELYKLWKEEPSSLKVLDNQLFPEFVENRVNWEAFRQKCMEDKLSQYMNVINVVELCKDRTRAAIETFWKHVIEKKYTAEEADVILSTCHSAKGMEWDNVQLCDDFIDFNKYKKGLNARGERVWLFDLESWGDNVNIVYVACTRAKKVLSIPNDFCTTLKTFDDIHTKAQHDFLEDRDSKIYKSLVLPLREELGLSGTQLLMETLISSNRMKIEPSEQTRNGVVMESVATGAITVAPPLLAPQTAAPLTLAPTTVAPLEQPTVAPQTPEPPTIAPPTVASPTVVPPTLEPPTVALPTVASPTAIVTPQSKGSDSPQRSGPRIDSKENEELSPPTPSTKAGDDDSTAPVENSWDNSNGPFPATPTRQRHQEPANVTFPESDPAVSRKRKR